MSLIHAAELNHREPLDNAATLRRHEAAVALAPAAWMPWNYAATRATVAAEPTDSAPDTFLPSPAASAKPLVPRPRHIAPPTTGRTPPPKR